MVKATQIMKSLKILLKISANILKILRHFQK